MRQFRGALASSGIARSPSKHPAELAQSANAGGQRKVGALVGHQLEF
jgi:hypothetical protein